MTGCVHLGGMKTFADSRPRTRLIVLLAAGLVIVLLAGIGIYGLILGPDTSPPHDRDPEPGASSSPVESGTPRPGRIAAVVGSGDPEEFARNVATAVFAWDTGSGLMPLDYSAGILEVGDPSGTENAATSVRRPGQSIDGGSSPLARGAPARRTASRSRARLIPARAGSTAAPATRAGP